MSAADSAAQPCFVMLLPEVRPLAGAELART
jgi:hypothetical protein